MRTGLASIQIVLCLKVLSAQVRSYRCGKTHYKLNLSALRFSPLSDVPGHLRRIAPRFRNRFIQRLGNGVGISLNYPTKSGLLITTNVWTAPVRSASGLLDRSSSAS